MIQILGIRLYTKPDGKIVETDATFFERNWRAESVADLFQNLPAYLKQIPPKERVNLFLTAAICTEKKREFHSTDVVWFDIDGLDLNRTSEYIESFCHALKVKESETGVVCSGRGLHFYIGLKTPIVDKTYFAESKRHYAAVLDMLGKAFASRGLPYKLDPSVWDARRLMRLPGTRNEKPGKEPCKAELLQAKIVPTDFDLAAFSGLPTVDKAESIDAESFQASFKPDKKAIYQGCEFLKYCRDHAGEVSEPEWYAALSITARFEDGNEESHAISKGHGGYSPEETDKKIEQALKASGPRTCKNIQNLWGACTKCPHWEKITSPILLRDPNEIRTEKSGFFKYHVDPKTGVMKRGEPAYEDLLKFFARKNPYRCTSEVCFVFNGTHYEEFKEERLKEFAQLNFKPECRRFMVLEFTSLVYRTNIVDSDAWAVGIERKVNFKNGVLDLDTMELKAHSPDFLFKYCLPYEYQPDASAPLFDKFLTEIMGGDADLIATLLEYGGYALSGSDCIYQKALVLEGEGNNAKSTFIELLKATAGRQAYAALSFSEMANADRRTSLDGALFNITEETPNKLWDTTVFKNLVSGGELQVRRLYKDGYTLRNRAKLIFSCNELPISPDNSRGFFRRFLIVPFKQKFSIELGNVDLEIGKKLKEELPGIFNRFLAGFRRLTAQGGFTKQTKVADNELEEYKELSDPMQYWFNECVTIEGEDFISIDTLYKSYFAFGMSTGHERNLVPKNIFGKRLRAMVPDYEKRYRRATKTRELRGLRCEVHGDQDF